VAEILAKLHENSSIGLTGVRKNPLAVFEDAVLAARFTHILAVKRRLEVKTLDPWV
jgi:hypothetical protein